MIKEAEALEILRGIYGTDPGNLSSIGQAIIERHAPPGLPAATASAAAGAAAPVKLVNFDIAEMHYLKELDVERLMPALLRQVRTLRTS